MIETAMEVRTRQPAASHAPAALHPLISACNRLVFDALTRLVSKVRLNGDIKAVVLFNDAECVGDKFVKVFFFFDTV